MKVRIPYEAETTASGVLKTLRQNAGLSQAEAAAAMHVGRTSVTNMESGLQPITLKHLETLAARCGLVMTITFQPAIKDPSA